MTSAIRFPARLDQRQRLQLAIQGTVQGIGFRPFVFRLAQELSLGGWVANTAQGALLELEGIPRQLRIFQERVTTELPRAGTIQSITSTTIPSLGESSFAIRSSQSTGYRRSVLSPDLATCLGCLHDLNDPYSRRYQYPFTTCAHCGPRYSIVRHLPYDRPNTTMANFPLCPDCQEEYDNPSDRRFHAEAIACPSCGPELALWDGDGRTVASQEQAWQQACDLIRKDGIVAVKGLGGFHLWVDALNSDAVHRLRTRKRRPDKPFAVLFPSMQVLRAHCLVSPEEERLLTSSAAPIVLVRKRIESSIAHAVGPANPYLGALLPYTPLHHMMIMNLGFPVVATSGNRSEEPLVYEEQKAVIRLRDLADAFLVHNRPIARPIDDSVMRVVKDKPLTHRRARGYVPTPLSVSSFRRKADPCPTILAVGGHLKNTIALINEDQIIASQHIGDLSTVEATTQFEQTVTDLLKLHECTPQAIACDEHPDYRTTRLARTFGDQHHLPVIPVQHHHAHIAACMAEHQLTGPILGIAWDGAGYGPDETLWGGEFLLCHEDEYKRVGHLRPFPLPGGSICMREPRRVALSLLHEIYADNLSELNLPPLRSLGTETARLLMNMIQHGVNSPLTSSIGRLFDGVSAILGLSHVTTFEGQAAMGVEFLAESAEPSTRSLSYHLPIQPFPPLAEELVVDWQPMIKEIVLDFQEGKNPAEIAWGFHEGLAHLIADVAQGMACSQVVLSGGVFQNGLLLTLTEQVLISKGIKVFVPRLFGPHDGGLSIGQCLVAGNQFLKHQEARHLQTVNGHDRGPQ